METEEDTKSQRRGDTGPGALDSGLQVETQLHPDQVKWCVAGHKGQQQHEMTPIKTRLCLRVKRFVQTLEQHPV